MRVIAGIARGRRLEAPPGLSTRPMPDRVRTSVFDALAPRLAAARVLDLYAGAGALGIEALSRGAARCLFVERSAEATACIRANLERLGFAACAEIWTCEAAAALARLGREPDRAFEIILLDPPFALFGSAALERELAAAGRLLAAGGRIVLRLETRSGRGAEPPAGLVGLDRRVYGRSTVVFLGAEGAPRAR